MYLRGEGVRQDFGVARMWFLRGAEFGDKESLNGLGIMIRDGLVPGMETLAGSEGVGTGKKKKEVRKRDEKERKEDLKKAVVYFTKAANQELAEAMVNLGKFYYFGESFAIMIMKFKKDRSSLFFVFIPFDSIS